ncbi:serine/threonine protein phosphatase, partial [Sesbania bispinosa]
IAMPVQILWFQTELSITHDSGAIVLLRRIPSRLSGYNICYSDYPTISYSTV